MPLYICNAVRGVISAPARVRIAIEITHIHCVVTGAPPTCVHAFFLEDAPHQHIAGKRVFLVGSISADHTVEQKIALIHGMRQSIHQQASVALNEIIVDTLDTPASWVMEGGARPPEAEENDWL